MLDWSMRVWIIGQAARMTFSRLFYALMRNLVPGMSQYGDSQEIFTDSEVEHVGNEELLKADEVPAAISQRREFFELSPK
jgi:hypothetical protein